MFDYSFFFEHVTTSCEHISDLRPNKMSQNMRFCAESYLNQGLLIFHDSKYLPRFLGGLQGVSAIETAWSKSSRLAALDDVKPNDDSLAIL